MLSEILRVFTVIEPVFFCVAAGYIWAVLKQPFDGKFISALIINISLPALLISHLGRQHVATDTLTTFMFAAVLATALMGVAAAIFVKLLRLPPRLFVSPMMFGNTGNMGLAVALLAYGLAGLSYALVFCMVTMAFLFTVGIWIPQGRVSIGQALRNPSLIGVAIGLYFVVSGAQLPNALYTPLDLLGGTCIPLVLFALGHAMADLKLRGAVLSVGLALLHLLFAAGIAFGLSIVFGFQGVERGVFILQCVMPIGTMSYLLVATYCEEEDTSDVASLALVSTMLSALVIPAVMLFWIK